MSPQIFEFGNSFVAREYIETYYAPILNLPELLNLARKIHSEYLLSSELDIRVLSEFTSIPHVTIENICIFDFQRYVAGVFLEAFPRGTAQIIDIGGGPTIYQHIALSLSAQHITHTEYLEQNRYEVIRWILGDNDAYNWDVYFELIKMMFRDDLLYMSLIKNQILSSDVVISSHALSVHKLLFNNYFDDYQNHVRKTIGNDVVFADVFSPIFSSLEFLGLYDVVTANFVIEGATDSYSQWEVGMIQTMGHVKSGGYLVLTALKNSSWYQVGSKRFPAVAISEIDLKSLCERMHFSIICLRLLDGGNKDKVGYESMIFLLAQKS